MGAKLCLGICELPIVEETRYDLGEPTPVFTTDEYKFRYLDVSASPLVVTLPRVGKYFVVDATPEEESCSKGKLAIGVSPAGIITSIEKLGRGCYQSRSIVASVMVSPSHRIFIS
jgi:exosome complex RNA-binding protein Rrp42 (RNase PH superfamily)